MRILPVPTLRSPPVRHDRLYVRPKIVECFLQRANKELPWGWEAKPWTLNRKISILHKGVHAFTFTYEALEHDIGRCLDNLQTFVLTFPPTQGLNHDLI